MKDQILGKDYAIVLWFDYVWLPLFMDSVGCIMLYVDLSSRQCLGIHLDGRTEGFWTMVVTLNPHRSVVHLPVKNHVLHWNYGGNRGFSVSFSHRFTLGDS